MPKISKGDLKRIEKLCGQVESAQLRTSDFGLKDLLGQAKTNLLEALKHVSVELTK